MHGNAWKYMETIKNQWKYMFYMNLCVVFIFVFVNDFKKYQNY